MQTAEMIPAEAFCFHHHVELSFITSLHDSGLIEVAKEEDQLFVYTSQLDILERFVMLYSELDINLEGLETINHLLQRMNEMQRQITALSNRLQYYESL